MSNCINLASENKLFYQQNGCNLILSFPSPIQPIVGRAKANFRKSSFPGRPLKRYNSKKSQGENGKRHTQYCLCMGVFVPFIFSFSPTKSKITREVLAYHPRIRSHRVDPFKLQSGLYLLPTNIHALLGTLFQIDPCCLYSGSPGNSFRNVLSISPGNLYSLSPPSSPHSFGSVQSQDRNCFELMEQPVVGDLFLQLSAWCPDKNSCLPSLPLTVCAT